MTHWIRFTHSETLKFGALNGSEITCYSGDLLGTNAPTGETLSLNDVTVEAPFTPTSILALWNNFHERAEKEGQTIPQTPLYFMKPVSSVIGPQETIYRPKGHTGRVIFEAELGIVIGKKCQNIAVEDVKDHIFGYTCVNDVTAVELLFEDKAFPQWTRCKGFDTFTPLGPVIQTELDLENLRIQAIQGDDVRQDYPVSDMIFSPYEIISLLSSYQTLVPGDLIACGTSVGARTMKPGSSIEIKIDGIGSLINSFDDHS